MTTGEKIGLLNGFGWVANQTWWLTLLILWMCTPGMMILIGVIFESRWIPLWSAKQFRSFFPGDFFLGGALLALLMLARRLPAKQAWYNSWQWHIGVFLFVLGVAFLMTFLEWNRGDAMDPSRYTLRTIVSPTKLYHNGFLYWLYGYVTVTTFFAVVAGYWWQGWSETSGSWLQKLGGLLWNERSAWLLLALIPLLIWGLLARHDSIVISQGSEARNLKTANAHISNWHPIWKPQVGVPRIRTDTF